GCCEKAFSAGLPGDRSRRAVGIAGCGCRRLGAVTPCAAIGISDLDAPFFVNRYVKKIKQVAAYVGAAAGPDVAPLNRHVRCGICCDPSESAIKRVGDVELPNTLKGGGVGVACG